MKSSLSFVLVGFVGLAAACGACTTKTTYIDDPPAQKPGQPGGENTPPPGVEPAPEGSNPLADLPADWQAKAAKYLDARAGEWLKSPPQVGQNVNCAMSCHTTNAYLLARKRLGDVATPNADAARAKFEARVKEAVAGTALPFYGKTGDAKTKESHATEAVLNAAALTFDDMDSGGTLGATTKTAIDRMFAQQGTNGSWSWLEFGLEPWETRNDWGVAMAAMVAGKIPEGTSPAQAAGIEKIKTYVKGRLDSMVLHDKAAVLWANGTLKGLLDDATATEVAKEIAATQLADGGFSLGKWGQGDLATSTAKTSDGYATAFATLALCSTPGGTKRADVHKGLTWIATHQQADGSWPGKSVNSTSARAKSFMTDAATSYAALAITTCAPTPAK
jgi:squalene-hopene/tetraprenyl-beta-curcumene cyclase